MPTRASLHSPSPPSKILESNSSCTLHSNHCNNQMAETLSITTNLASLSQAISDMNTRATSVIWTMTAFIPLLSHYNPAKPFGLFSRFGGAVDADTCAPLSEPWDSQVETFPSFIINVCIYDNKLKWNDATPHSILSVPTGGEVTWLARLSRLRTAVPPLNAKRFLFQSFSF